MKDYKELELFVKSRELVRNVYDATKTFPKEEIYGLTNQIRRSAVSILSNISEGMGRQHKSESIHFLHISRGSIYELEAQLLISLDLHYIEEDKHQQLDNQIQTSRKLLNGFINYLKGKNNAIK